MGQLDNNLWDKEEENTWEEENEYLEEEQEQIEDSESYSLDNSETIEEFLDREEVSVVDNARIRLEQGRLYEMLIKHNLFDGVDAMPQAVVKVQSEIKEFIIERLEILLGMKSEKQKEVHQIIKESQFNDLEVQALKMIASKVTKGASEEVPSVSEKPKNELNTIKPIVAKSGLNSIKKPDPVVNQKKPVKEVPAKKISKPEFKKTEKTTQDLSLDGIVKKDMKYIESLKKMSLTDANKIVSERHARPQPKIKLDQESINRQYAAKMSLNEEANAFTALLKMAQKK
jgi:hypothetical protein